MAHALTALCHDSAAGCQAVLDTDGGVAALAHAMEAGGEVLGYFEAG